jgi:hypothetical protein
MNKRIVFLAFLTTVLFVVPVISHARLLNVNTGRFQTMDAFEGDQQDPQSLHKYAYCQADPVNRVDPLGSDSYLFFDTIGGPTFDPGAGHVAVGVDFQGEILRRDAAWGSVGPLARFPDQKKARFGSDIVIIFPDKSLPNGQYSDDVIAQVLNSGKTHLTYVYCSTYAAEVMKAGGYNLGHGFSPNSVMKAAEKVPTAKIHNYKSHAYSLSVTVSPTQTISVNVPTIFIQMQTVPFQDML